MRAGYFGATTKVAVTDTPDSFVILGANESRHAYIVQSDKTIHVTRDGTDASADNGLRIPANTPMLVATFAGEDISFVLGEGEADGFVWFTETDAA